MADNFNNFNKFPGQSSPHPMYGIRPGFNVSDMPSYATSETKVLTSITAPAISAAQSPGARYISVSISFTDPTSTCQVDLYQTVSGNDTLQRSVTGVSYANDEVNFGNFEGININGGTFKIGISNMSNNSPITVSYKVNG